MEAHEPCVVFRLEGRRFAIAVSAVDRVVWAVDVTPLPDAPDVVRGVVNVQGDILPVVDVRGRLSMPVREVLPADRFIVARTSRRTVVLWVDDVEGILRPTSDEVVPPESVVEGEGPIRGMVKLPDGVLLICDLERFLSAEEEDMLDAAMEEAG